MTAWETWGFLVIGDLIRGHPSSLLSHDFVAIYNLCHQVFTQESEDVWAKTTVQWLKRITDNDLPISDALNAAEASHDRHLLTSLYKIQVSRIPTTVANKYHNTICIPATTSHWINAVTQAKKFSISEIGQRIEAIIQHLSAQAPHKRYVSERCQYGSDALMPLTMWSQELARNMEATDPYVGTSGVDLQLSEHLLPPYRALDSDERPGRWSRSPVACVTACSRCEQAVLVMNAMSREDLLALARLYQSLADEATAVAAIETPLDMGGEVAPPIAQRSTRDSCAAVGVSRGDTSSPVEDLGIGCNKFESYVPIASAMDESCLQGLFPESPELGLSLRSAEAVWAMSCEELTTVARTYQLSHDPAIIDPGFRITCYATNDTDGSDCDAVSPGSAMCASQDGSQVEGKGPEPRWGARNISDRVPNDIALDVNDDLDMIGTICAEKRFSASHGCASPWRSGFHIHDLTPSFKKSRRAVSQSLSRMRDKESGRTSMENTHGSQDRTRESRQPQEVMKRAIQGNALQLEAKIATLKYLESPADAVNHAVVKPILSDLLTLLSLLQVRGTYEKRMLKWFPTLHHVQYIKSKNMSSGKSFLRNSSK
ncbi:hypothetical protein B0H13DRAFT_1903292 [Mycena leptocephala]|nr:hypothetical protein B0H13DRAFT_1903292 [Mycena leptocephala]